MKLPKWIRRPDEVTEFLTLFVVSVLVVGFALGFLTGRGFCE